jgi:hypothetical protein
MMKTADDVEAVSMLFQRLEDRCEFKACPFGFWSPAVHDRAVREVDEAETALRRGDGLALCR